VLLVRSLDSFSDAAAAGPPDQWDEDVLPAIKAGSGAMLNFVVDCGRFAPSSAETKLVAPAKIVAHEASARQAVLNEAKALDTLFPLLDRLSILSGTDATALEWTLRVLEELLSDGKLHHINLPKMSSAETAYCPFRRAEQNSPPVRCRHSSFERFP
jgi:hypothetical protein